MISRFQDQIDSHITDKSLHQTVEIDGTTLKIGSSSLPTETADEHIKDSSIHIVATAHNGVLTLTKVLDGDLVDHLADSSIHITASIDNGELVFYKTSVNTSLIDLEKYVPQFIREMNEPHEVFISQGKEVAREWLKEEDLEKQMFPDEADWSLSLWETNYGIQTNTSLTTESRRKGVIARLTIPATTTLALVQKTAEEMIGGTIWVEEQPEKSHINIWLMDRDFYTSTWNDVKDYGTWNSITSKTWLDTLTELNAAAMDLSVFEAWLQTYKPAHLGYTLDRFLMRWSDCLAYTWKDLTLYTWLGVLLGLKEFVTTWSMVQDEYDTWSALNDKQTWYTTRYLKEKA